MRTREERLQYGREWYEKNRKKKLKQQQEYIQKPKVKKKRKKRYQKYYLKNKKKILKHSKEYYEKNKDKILERIKKYREKHPKKVKAQSILNHYIRDNKIDLSNIKCQVCLRLFTDKHHPDYNEPLGFVPLCKKHHTISLYP